MKTAIPQTYNIGKPEAPISWANCLLKFDDFAKYADNAWDKIDYSHKQIRNLEKMRDGLLPKLMSGEVKVNV